MERNANRVDCGWDRGDRVRDSAASPAGAQTADDPARRHRSAIAAGESTGMFHHAAHTVQDKFVGYPDTFIEPPLGYYVNEQFAVQVAKANTHRFTLYRSDFLPGTSLFSPSGASRFNIMSTRIPGWMGPITVEWTPDQPALAEQRRQALLETMQKAGLPLLADRVVIGPSPYPGAMGVEAVNNNGNTILRNRRRRSDVPVAADRNGRHGSSLRCRLTRSTVERARATPPDWARARSIVLGDLPGGLRRRWGRAAWSPRGNRRARRRTAAASPGGCRRRRSGRPDSVGRLRRPSSTPKPPTGRRSRCISTSGGFSSRRATSTRPCSNIRRRSRSSKPEGAGRFRPADSALAHRRMAGALDRLGRFAQAEVHYQKALKFSPQRPESLERRRLQLLSPGAMA